MLPLPGPAVCLWYLALARTGDQRRHWFGAGLLAALAHLSRADGLLFLGIGGLLLWPRRWDRQTLLAQVQSGLFLLVGYLLLMGPWLLRNWRALGRPLTTAGSQTLFLTNYDDLFAYGRQFSLAEYLAWGGGNILSSKLAGLSTALQTFIAICGLVFLTPLIIVAWRQLWRNAETRVRILPLTLYTVLLFVAMSLFFTFPGMRGGLFHSTTAIWPWLMALAPAGLRQSIQWIAARRPSWQPATAWRVFAPALVVLALALTVAAGGLRGQQDEVVSDITRSWLNGYRPGLLSSCGTRPAFITTPATRPFPSPTSRWLSYPRRGPAVWSDLSDPGRKPSGAPD
ncbi:MAG: hypothetical protein H6651_08760 [Ardenticatenales bacterium]|nr:hypothetical protein [Ardenticatenales bacterium]